MQNALQCVDMSPQLKRFCSIYQTGDRPNARIRIVHKRFAHQKSMPGGAAKVALPQGNKKGDIR
jgi:hypothetical protein